MNLGTTDSLKCSLFPCQLRWGRALGVVAQSTRILRRNQRNVCHDTIVCGFEWLKHLVRIERMVTTIRHGFEPRLPHQFNGSSRLRVG